MNSKTEKAATTRRRKPVTAQPTAVPRPLADTTAESDVLPAAARVLVVEDQDDVRRLLVTALQIEGYDVAEAPNAREGLRVLQGSHFDLVLTDYAMPGGTGTWMLHEATRQGLLEGTASLIVTAHPDVREHAPVPVVQKPLDLDRFLEQVRRVLQDGHGRDGDGSQESYEPRGRAERVSGRHRVELVLYVSASSPASIQARRNLERILDDFDAAQVLLTITDLGREPFAGDSDRVAFTPTLVKRSPEPRMWILGNLREPEIIGDLLRACGVDAKT